MGGLGEVRDPTVNPRGSFCSSVIHSHPKLVRFLGGYDVVDSQNHTGRIRSRLHRCLYHPLWFDDRVGGFNLSGVDVNICVIVAFAVSNAQFEKCVDGGYGTLILLCASRRSRVRISVRCLMITSVLSVGYQSRHLTVSS